jgi:ADP-ribosylglycohydrolase
MKNPNPLMLVRIAQGDAYGMSCEYIKFPRDQAIYDEALKFEHYGTHPMHKLEKGQYTDDTQMSIAVSEVLIEHNVRPSINQNADLLKRHFAKSFFDCFKRDQRDGYSRGFQDLLEKANSPEHLLTMLKPKSDKNGAAMRSVPLGVLDQVNHVKYVANIQAKITHDTDEGTAASIIVALMSHYVLHHNDPLSELRPWLRANTTFPTYYLDEWKGDAVTDPNVGINTARAVLQLVSTGTSLIDIARRTIEWGGDTDSVLAIAWGIASTRMREQLPAFFGGGLEDGPYGYDFLSDLGHKLMEKYK